MLKLVISPSCKNCTSYPLRIETHAAFLTAFYLQVRDIMQHKGYGERIKQFWVVWYSTSEVLASQDLVYAAICFAEVMILLCVHSLAA